MTKLRGFTLIELMVAMGLLASLSIVVLSASVSGTQNFAALSNISRENSLFSDVFNRIDRNIRTGVDFPDSFYDMNANYYQADASTLIIRIPSLKSDGTPCEQNFDHIIYRISANQMQELVRTDPISARSETTQTLMADVLSPSAFTKTLIGSRPSYSLTLIHQRTVSGKSVSTTRMQTMVARND
jgi:prepilin-type N-terminal cleavage/methylation domain-containing protein